MQKGWDATGRLAAHWGKIGGRDKLAAKTGIAPTTLSGYNSGERKLGPTNARRIAKALGVTTLDLGAPAAAADSAAELALVDHLELLQAEVLRLVQVVTRLANEQPPALRRQLLRELAGGPQ